MTVGLGLLAVLATQAVGIGPAQAATILPGSVQVKQDLPRAKVGSTQVANARCDPGQRVLGGGAFSVGGVHAVITELQPIHPTDGTVDSFHVTAAADQFGIPGAWAVQAFAFCATAPASLGVEIISKRNNPTSNATDQAPTACPAGKQLIGAGGKIENGNGQVDLGLFTNSSGPFASGSAAFAKEDLDGFPGFYTVTGYSVCARAITFGDLQQFKVTQPPSTPSANVSCPSGLRLTGLAGGTATPGTHLQKIIPATTNAPSFANFGVQSSGPPAGPWDLETTVFCAK